MIPGPVIIRECPHCKGRFKETTVLSGNTFGARYWTDGKMEADMLPDMDWLVTCPNCMRPVWVDEALEVGQVELPYKKSDGDFVGAELIEFGRSPSAEGYLNALGDESMPSENQAYIRFRLWRMWNDTRRYGMAGEMAPLINYEIDNMEALIDLLDESDLNELVTKAEINRELGRFEEAIRLLDWPDNELNNSRIDYIRDLARNKDCHVREFLDSFIE